jgi:hypothetical protein
MFNSRPPLASVISGFCTRWPGFGRSIRTNLVFTMTLSNFPTVRSSS